MKKKIKILHVIGRYPKGGVGSFIKNIEDNIDHDKFQFDYLVNDSEIRSDFFNEIKIYGGKYWILPKLALRNTGVYLSALADFYKKHNDYDAIHVHSVNIALFNYYFGKKNGIKNLIAHSHSTKSSDVLLRRIRNFFLIFPVKKCATHIMACNYDSAKFLFGNERASSSELMLIKNAINTEKFSYNYEVRNVIRKQYGWEEKLIIGHVGHFIPVKNHTFLIDVFVEILKQKSNALLVLIGEGELRKVVEKKVKDLNIQDSIIFLGLRKDVYKYMQAFDVFVLPSIFEGLPVVGVEAQTSGLPCYFSNNISCDIEITNSVEFLELEHGPRKWADHIVETTKKYTRNDCTDDVIAAGYDIKLETKNLEKYYFNMVENIKELGE